jgi:hypothetical protein
MKAARMWQPIPAPLLQPERFGERFGPSSLIPFKTMVLKQMLALLGIGSTSAPHIRAESEKIKRDTGDQPPSTLLTTLAV